MTRLVRKRKFSTIKYKLLAHTFKNKMYVYSVNFSPNGLSFISGSADNTIKLWSIDGPLIRTFTGHTMSVSSVNFSPDGSSFISGSRDNTIKLWSIDGSLIRTFTGHTKSVLSVNFSPDGSSFISGSWKKINIWSIDGPLIRTFTECIHWVSSVNFSPDNLYFISGSSDGTIKLWAPSKTVLRTKLIKSARKDKKVTRRTTDSKTLRDLPSELFNKISEYL